WTPLGEPKCFARRLGAQGLLAIGGEAAGSGLFAGSRLSIDGRSAEIEPVQTTEGARAPSLHAAKPRGASLPALASLGRTLRARRARVSSPPAIPSGRALSQP